MFARRAIAAWILATAFLTAAAIIWAGDLIALLHIAPKAFFWAIALALLGAGIGWEMKHRAEKTEAFADEATAEPDVLVRMLDDALAKAERKPPLLVEPIDLTALLTQASKRHGRTDLAGKSSAVHTLGDPAAITQLFQILIANALASGSRAIVRIDHGTTLVAVHVDDDGPGVPRAQRAVVFEQRTYRRLPASERTAEREACIAARHIARNHGGDILISSSPEGGARFTVHLPLHVETETVHPAVMAS
jgi:two-component system, OmpR family, osmolarity sensor histidine kinase EnvZ